MQGITKKKKKSEGMKKLREKRYAEKNIKKSREEDNVEIVSLGDD